jgi:hypothetical protein
MRPRVLPYCICLPLLYSHNILVRFQSVVPAHVHGIPAPCCSLLVLPLEVLHILPRERQSVVDALNLFSKNIGSLRLFEERLLLLLLRLGEWSLGRIEEEAQDNSDVRLRRLLDAGIQAPIFDQFRQVVGEVLDCSTHNLGDIGDWDCRKRLRQSSNVEPVLLIL